MSAEIAMDETLDAICPCAAIAVAETDAGTAAPLRTVRIARLRAQEFRPQGVADQEAFAREADRAAVVGQ